MILKKISVIYNGIDPCWFDVIQPQVKETVLKKYALNKKYILSVGTLYPKKNIERVLSAYLALPYALRQEYDLVIVGKAGWDCDDLVQQINAEQGKGHVKWLNYVSFAELRAIYQSANLLTFVSLDEGFGFPIIEAFASKVPVITSNVSSMPEIAGDAATLVDPTSVAAISEAMKRMLESENQKLIEQGYNRAKEFSWQKGMRKRRLRFIRGIFRRIYLSFKITSPARREVIYNY